MSKRFFFLNFLLFFGLFFILGGCQTTDTVRNSESKVISSPVQDDSTGKPQRDAVSSLFERPSITYEEYLKMRSLELGKFAHIYMSASGDGKRVALPLAKKNQPDIFEEMSVWEYSTEQYSFIRHPYRFSRESSRPFEVAVSHDGKLMAYGDGNNKIIVVDLDRANVLRTVSTLGDKIYGLAISRDNKRLALSYRDQHFGGVNLSTYSIEDGKFLNTANLENSARVTKMVFSADGSLIVEYSVPDEDRSLNPRHMYIYDNNLSRSKEIRSVRKYEGDYLIVDEYSLAGVFPDGNRLALSHLDYKGDNSETGIYDVRSLEWVVSGFPLQHRMFFGRADRFVSGKNEYIWQEKGILLLQEKLSEFHSLEMVVVYVAEADHWVFFSKNEQSILEPASNEDVRAALAIDEGKRTLSAGFKSPGIIKIKEAIAISPLYEPLQRFNFYDQLFQENLSITDVGELLLFHYRELRKMDKVAKIGVNVQTKNENQGVLVGKLNNADGPAVEAGIREGDVILAVNGKITPDAAALISILQNRPPGTTFELKINRDGHEHMLSVTTASAFANSQSIVSALNRLVEYGMLALHAGHPELTIKAVEEMRLLKKEYPLGLPSSGWKLRLEGALALEAAVMAYNGDVDRAYDHLFEQDGLVHQGSRSAASYLTTYPEYWTPLYADRKKLAYLLEVEDADLPDPEFKAVAPHPYPDLKGTLREPDATANMLEESTR